MDIREPLRRSMRAAAKPLRRPSSFDFEAGRGRHRVWGTAFLSHHGLSVTLVGGEVPHIGAVAVSIPRPSLANPKRRSATTSVFALLGHKEDELARPMAADLAQSLDRTVVVVAGVHIREAAAADLVTVRKNAARAARLIVARVGRVAAGSDGSRLDGPTDRTHLIEGNGRLGRVRSIRRKR